MCKADKQVPLRLCVNISRPLGQGEVYCVTAQYNTKKPKPWGIAKKMTVNNYKKVVFFYVSGRKWL